MKKIHIMGVNGSGAKGIAFLAKKMGYKVTGCDLSLDGHDKKHLDNIDLLVVSPAVLYQNKKHPELVEGLKRKMVVTWEEFLGKVLLKDKKLICIAGTHGKSTTTAMAAKMLIDNSFDPIVVIGAYVPKWKGNSRFGKGEYALVEADEFNNNFLHYHPDIIVLNNIEFDHPDFFKNEKEVKDSFKKFIKNLKGEKVLIQEMDSQNLEFKLKVFGEHNQKNANMVYVLGQKLGIRKDERVKAIENFKGIGRRMELVSEKNGTRIYDDYAHHPTAIKTTLEGLRKEFPNEKILAIIEPHGYKRTKALLKNYKGVFDSVDGVIIGPIFKARDVVDKSIMPEKVAKISGNKEAYGINNVNEIIKNTKLLIDNYGFNIIVVMGAGESNIWARRIADALHGQAKKKFSELTTFKIGGEIKYYFEVSSEKEISDTVKFAKDNKLPIFIIGGGSDILISDKDFNGVVVKFTGKNTKFQILDSKFQLVTAEAGLAWDDLVKLSVENNLQGIECLSWIPGTVGAAPIQNIGAYGQELKDTFVELTAYDIENEKFVKFNIEDCKFGYRDSIFKTDKYWQKFLITSVTLQLKKYDESDLELETIRNQIIYTRQEKLEDPDKIANAGSFFKNPIVSEEVKNKLKNKYPEIVIFPFGNSYKVSAGWLLENTGFKGYEYGNAGVSPKHALILINKTGKAAAKEVFDLSEKIIAEVDKKFEVKLEREVQLINF